MSMQDKNYSEEDLGYPTAANGRIPAFANRDEEAAFRDSHDITDFLGAEMQPIEVVVRESMRPVSNSRHDRLGGEQTGS